MTSSSLAAAEASGQPHGILQLEGVSKTFAGVRGAERTVVLDHLDLSIGPDESVGIIGPNGAGKSTLLKLVAGVTPPSAGRIRREGRTCSVIELGAAVHPDLSGRENIELLSALYGIPRHRLPSLFDTIVAFAELGHAIDLPTRQYSTGMIARLAFATAAFSDPELLLIDEVLSVGDLPFQFRCRERVEELRREGTTVVLVSHDLDLVAAVCDRLVLLRDSVIEADGPASRIISRYLGLPDPGDQPIAPLQILLSQKRVTAGEPVEFAVQLEGPVADLGVDLVIAEHPALAAHGVQQSVIAASDRVRVGSGRSSFRLETRSLPPGRYELHGRLDPDGEDLAAAPAPFVLTGERPELYTSQLECTARVRELAPPTPR